MMSVKLICVGKMKEKHYIEAFAEYNKRLAAYCKFETVELNEERVSENPSMKEIQNCLDKEALMIEKQIPKGAYVIAMCVEAKNISSEKLAEVFETKAAQGVSKLCFVVGGSHGLAEDFKKKADFKLSMSSMTFPHHLARVMLAEQIYRAFTINEGSKYHK